LDLAISDLELLIKFADDTKISREIRSDADRVGLQQALDKLVAWTEKWGMLFNVKK
jgi:hypothetical protein